jgi:phosphohistidine phosphatase SixA
MFKIIFVRHALAPGNRDPINFKIDDCFTQRNLNKEGINQALTIGEILKKMIYFLKQFIQAYGVDACKLQNVWMLVQLCHIKV